MSTNLSIRRFVDRFCFPASTKNGYTIPLLGLDAAGKTTLLQRLKVGDLVETIPTIGFHLEMAEVQFDQTSPHVIKMPSWDVGGCGKRFPPAFLTHITQTVNSDALIWLVDSSERERLPESVEEFWNALRMLSYPNTDNRLATKQDLPGVMNTTEVVRNFPAGPSIFVVGAGLDQSLTDGALPAAFQWLVDSVENTRAGRPLPLSPTEDPRSLIALEIKLDSWLERAENDSSAARFLRQFETASLSEWDHYTHVRVIYSMLSAFGRNKGREIILQGIQKYASTAQAEEWSFNFTMTYFWIQVVHFGICGMPTAPHPDSDSGSISYLESMLDSDTLFDSQSIISEPASDWSVVEDHTEDCIEQGVRDDQESVTSDEEESEERFDAEFVRFLLLNPHVVDEDLWTEYYSKELMMSPKAAAKMVLPDKRRLPNLVGRDLILSSFRWKRA